MKTIIAIAVGVYLGRKIYRMYDYARLRSEVKQKLLRLLIANGVTKEQAEKHVVEMMSN